VPYEPYYRDNICPPVPYEPHCRHNICLFQKTKSLRKFRNTSIFSGIFQIALKVQMQAYQTPLPAESRQPIF
jgi:hypothetical protein